MNKADMMLVEQLRTKPWTELSLMGVRMNEAGELILTWVENGLVQDTWAEPPPKGKKPASVLSYLMEVRAFARGGIPVAWNHFEKKFWLEQLLHTATKVDTLDTELVFCLRKRSRWLDPAVWARARTGQDHPIEVIAKAVGLQSDPFGSPDPAALAHRLVKREGFPVRADWTVGELADWQDDAAAAHRRNDEG